MDASKQDLAANGPFATTCLSTMCSFRPTPGTGHRPYPRACMICGPGSIGPANDRTGCQGTRPTNR